MQTFGKVTTLLTIALLGVSQLEAQTKTCRIVFPERPGNAPKFGYLFDGKKSHQTPLPSMNLSPVIELPAGNILLAMTAEKIADPELMPANAPLLKVPAGTTDFYILVSPDPGNQTFPVKLNLVDTGKGKLKPGQTLWFNMTPHKVVAKLGNSNMAVAPMTQTISDAPLNESGYYVAKLGYQNMGEGPLLPITKQQWWCDVKSKHLGFIVNTGGKLPKIYYFRDFRLPKHVLEEIKRAEKELDSE